jgi:magnesium transporter
MIAATAASFVREGRLRRWRRSAASVGIRQAGRLRAKDRRIALADRAGYLIRESREVPMLSAYRSNAELLAAAEFPGSGEELSALVWIDMLNPTAEEDRAVEEALGISIPSQDEMQEIELSSRLYAENGAEFLTMTALANLDSDEAVKTPITFILKRSALVTVRWSDPRPFTAYRMRAARQKEALSGSGEQVMMGLLEALVDRTADALERVGNEIDAISRAVFGNKARKVNKKTHDLQAVIEQLGRKSELLTMVQESLVSLGRLTAYHVALEQVSKPTPSARETKSMLKMIQRDAVSLGEHARGLIGRINFLLDATLGLINLEQNQIIKIFSVAAVVFLPPTLVASIYGMNFEFMPELAWPFGYPFALGLMVLSAVLPYLFFKRKGWL